MPLNIATLWIKANPEYVGHILGVFSNKHSRENPEGYWMYCLENHDDIETAILEISRFAEKHETSLSELATYHDIGVNWVFNVPVDNKAISYDLPPIAMSVLSKLGANISVQARFE